MDDASVEAMSSSTNTITISTIQLKKEADLEGKILKFLQSKVGNLSISIDENHWKGGNFDCFVE